MFLLQVMLPGVSFGKSESSVEAHRLPILSSFPSDGATMVRPDTTIKISLNAQDKNFNRFRQQFEKGNFKVTLNGEIFECSYDKASKTIIIKNSILERYTDYSVCLSLKADMRSPENNSGNSTYSFNFRTGSSLNEAVYLTADFVKIPIRVTDDGQVRVKVTDDYGLPATNATVRLTSNTEKVVTKQLQLDATSNGEGVIDYTHHERGKIL